MLEKRVLSNIDTSVTRCTLDTLPEVSREVLLSATYNNKTHHYNVNEAIVEDIPALNMTRFEMKLLAQDLLDSRMEAGETFHKFGSDIFQQLASKGLLDFKDCQILASNGAIAEISTCTEISTNLCLYAKKIDIKGRSYIFLSEFKKTAGFPVVSKCPNSLQPVPDFFPGRSSSPTSVASCDAYFNSLQVDSESWSNMRRHTTLNGHKENDGKPTRRESLNSPTYRSTVSLDQYVVSKKPLSRALSGVHPCHSDMNWRGDLKAAAKVPKLSSVNVPVIQRTSKPRDCADFGYIFEEYMVTEDPLPISLKLKSAFKFTFTKMKLGKHTILMRCETDARVSDTNSLVEIKCRPFILDDQPQGFELKSFRKAYLGTYDHLVLGGIRPSEVEAASQHQKTVIPRIYNVHDIISKDRNLVHGFCLAEQFLGKLMDVFEFNSGLSDLYMEKEMDSRYISFFVYF